MKHLFNAIKEIKMPEDMRERIISNCKLIVAQKSSAIPMEHKTKVRGENHDENTSGRGR